MGGVKNRIFCTTYGYYLFKLLRKFNLASCVKFVGPQDASNMKAFLLSSNLYILPSYIENSPNSLGEAQMLGVPCIAANVGGVEDMIPNLHCGKVYRYEDVDLLAYHIINIFRQDSFDNEMERNVAMQRHDHEKNIQDLIMIYKTLS